MSNSLRRLDEVAEVIDSLHKTPEYQPKGISMVRVTDIKPGFIALTDTVKVSDEVYEEFTKKYKPQRGDIVFSRVGTYGLSSFVNTDEYFCLGQNTALMKSNINSRYLYYCLQYSGVKEQIEQSVVGSTQKTISLKSIKALKIPIFSVEKIDAIADVLGALDDKIECNRRINQTLEAMAQAIYKHWFVDFGPFRDGEREEIPTGWREGKLGDIAKNVRIAANPQAILGETPYIGLEHMPKGSIALSEWGTASDVSSNKSVFRQKQILFGKLRPYFKKVGIAPLDGVCSSDILVIEPLKPCFFGLTLCLLIQDEFISFTDAASGGTRMPRISWEQMTRYPVVIPPNDVAALFSLQVEEWMKLVISNIHESHALARTCDYLLPKLLSGEVEIREAEEVVEAAV